MKITTLGSLLLVSLTTASQLKALGPVSNLTQVLTLHYRLVGVLKGLNKTNRPGQLLAHFMLTVNN